MTVFLKRISTALLLLSVFLLSPAWAEGRDFLVDADWLAAEKEKNKDLVILEARYHPHRFYTVGHIEGAVQVQRFKDLGDNLAKPIMRFPSQGKIRENLALMGCEQRFHHRVVRRFQHCIGGAFVWHAGTVRL